MLRIDIIDNEIKQKGKIYKGKDDVVVSDDQHSVHLEGAINECDKTMKTLIRKLAGKDKLDIWLYPDIALWFTLTSQDIPQVLISDKVGIWQYSKSLTDYIQKTPSFGNRFRDHKIWGVNHDRWRNIPKLKKVRDILVSLC